MNKEKKYYVFRLKKTHFFITEYQSAIKRDIKFISTNYHICYASLLYQLTVLPFEEKCFASRKGMPQDLHQVRLR